MSSIKITKPRQRWLFGGIGFHNSECTMTPIMSDVFLNEKIIKTFREISPTFSRIFAGYADWTKEAMDHFAEYYDKTFRKAGTVLYMVPGRMPMPTDDFDMDVYAERVAENLEYLIKEKNCRKIRYYCVTNELSVGNTYAYLEYKLDLFKEMHMALYKAFHRRGLDVGLIATDAGGRYRFPHVKWAVENMDEITDCYCNHHYHIASRMEDMGLYADTMYLLEEVVAQANRKEKRFMLGEFGIMPAHRKDGGEPMKNDTSYAVEYPEEEGLFALTLCELSFAVVNSGCLAGACWTLFDYPDPFLREDGETEEEKRQYEVARFSGQGISFRYNKHGMIRWCDEEQDYSARASLYTMGYMAKFFKKGSRVLHIGEIDDSFLRACAVTNADGSMTIAVINWENCSKTVSLEVGHSADKPFRRYEFIADRPYSNRFNDLQPHTDMTEMQGNRVDIEMAPKSIVFLTTDYVQRTPGAVNNVRVEGNRLCWDKCEEDAHCYYRVHASAEENFVPSYENQIASTVAECTEVTGGEQLYYKVVSVDKSGNVGI